jgi:hypothetical protein
MTSDGLSLGLESEDLGCDLGEDVRVGFQEFCCVSLRAKRLRRHWSIVNRLDPKVHNKLPQRFYDVVVPRAIKSVILQKPLNHGAHEFFGKDDSLLVGAGLKEKFAPSLLREVRALIQIDAIFFLQWLVLFHRSLAVFYLTEIERCDEIGRPI